MAKKKSKKVTEAGFIPGIYNYCDRWCEKCKQTAHCMSFMMSKKIEEKGGFNLGREVTRGEENIWACLKDVFESTYEVLRELAEERGIGVEDIYASENINKELWGEGFENRLNGENDVQLVESSDILRMCVIYEHLADKCLEKIFNIMEDKEKKGKRPEEYLEVVSWYLDLIQAKVRRALYGYQRRMSQPPIDDDFNGSAKVVLLAVDRSLEAWQEISRYYPDFRFEIGHLRVVLEQISVDMEKQFPEAWQFQRPGFDRYSMTEDGEK